MFKQVKMQLETLKATITPVLQKIISCNNRDTMYFSYKWAKPVFYF